MNPKILDFKFPFLKKPRSRDIPIEIVRDNKFKAWLKKQKKTHRSQIEHSTFQAHQNEVLAIRDKDGAVERILCGCGDAIGFYDTAALIKFIQDNFSKAYISKSSFSFDIAALTPKDLEHAAIGWALGNYRFDVYKKYEEEIPQLVFPKGTELKRVEAWLESIYTIRNLINMPANDLGPEEIEAAARNIAERHDASVEVIIDKNLQKKNFPLIYTVGQASPKRPRLIDLHWGNKKDPKVTLVGKGVSFDTGGLDIKPSQYMKLMKKDMGGAAHALALAHFIMALKLPLRLRLLIPAVENAVGGAAFRPGDIIKSRKGLTVENTHTDAEGRLILADALAYACEEEPDLLIDFATLTGSARAALGHDVPPFFSNNDKLRSHLQELSSSSHDQLWPMPLWQEYRKHIKSPVADLVNSADVPGDLIYSALFLESFVKDSVDWLHLDIFAWQQSSAPGTPKGGKEMGLQAIVALLESRYGD